MAAGVPVSASDIDFYIETDPSSGKEMVIVSDTVHQKQHADFWAKHIVKFEDILRDLQVPLQAAAAPRQAAVY